MNFSDYELGLKFRDIARQISQTVVEQLRPAPRYAVVQSVNLVNYTAMCIYNGETVAVEVKLGSTIPRVNSVVRIEGTRGDRYVADAIGQNLITELVAREHNQLNHWQTLTGGGIRKTFLDLYIQWTLDIFAGAVGFGAPENAPGGFWRLSPPPNGTTIVGAYGMTNSVVPSSGIYAGMIPLPNWSTLWYELPLGSTTEQTDHTRWRITSIQRGVPFQTPYNWIPICTRNAEGYVNTIRWWDGRTESEWKTLTLASPWLSFGPDHHTPQYRLYNGKVELRGLMKNGGTPTVVAYLPVGFRPSKIKIYHLAGPVSSGYPIYQRMNIASDGALLYEGQNSSFVSLEGITFEPEL